MIKSPGGQAVISNETPLLITGLTSMNALNESVGRSISSGWYTRVMTDVPPFDGSYGASQPSDDMSGAYMLEPAASYYGTPRASPENSQMSLFEFQNTLSAQPPMLLQRGGLTGADFTNASTDQSSNRQLPDVFHPAVIGGYRVVNEHKRRAEVFETASDQFGGTRQLPVTESREKLREDNQTQA